MDPLTTPDLLQIFNDEVDELLSAMRVDSVGHDVTTSIGRGETLRKFDQILNTLDDMREIAELGAAVLEISWEVARGRTSTVDEEKDERSDSVSDDLSDGSTDYSADVSSDGSTEDSSDGSKDNSSDDQNDASREPSSPHVPLDIENNRRRQRGDSVLEGRMVKRRRFEENAF
ncbi:hypothetical protein N7539_000094 [Penicillium diatomitis]|uniref:Uncharacterized protein n=1 Tax=Penicillium diatomitis TaxID=2819901 RepID=A0A9X0C1V2_9EURO|nr:uncharacterized protein N7539_000094 [Penicillium diatomitis]KAJ5494978.1 hypothetical protein N7539_000094 [Penicillium diatomitis]